MGVFDMAKMIQKAREAQKKMKQMKAVGQGDVTKVMINGTYETEEVNTDIESLAERFKEIDRSVLEKIARFMDKNYEKAANNANKELQKIMSSSTSMDDLKDMLQG